MAKVRTKKDLILFDMILSLAEYQINESSELNKTDRELLDMIKFLRDSRENNFLIEIGK